MSEVTAQKGMSKTKKVLIGMGVLVVLCALGASDDDTESAPSSKATAPDANAPDWFKARVEACGKYQAAANDITKSAIFNQYLEQAQFRSGTANKLRGVLSHIETPQGGSQVWIHVSTPYGVFDNNDMVVGHSEDREIQNGSSLYKTVGELAEGAAVFVSATDIVPFPNVFSERLGVCGDKWLAKFTDLEPAK